MAREFVHLHVHSQYSFLTSAVKLDDLAKRAKGHGMRAVALTDHANMFGAITFYLENKEKVEAYLSDQERRWDALRKERAKSSDPLMNRLREAKEHASPGRR